jgi:hypothetical protein
VLNAFNPACGTLKILATFQVEMPRSVASSFALNTRNKDRDRLCFVLVLRWALVS